LTAVYADSDGAGPRLCASYTYSLCARRLTSQRYSLTRIAEPSKAPWSSAPEGAGFARRAQHRS